MAGKRKKKKRIGLIIAFGFLVLLIIVFMLGPSPANIDLTHLQVHHFPSDLHALEDSLNRSEAALPLKKDNHARIVWEKPYEKTPYSMVYLHGNGASQEEGDPIHEALAHRYGCNLYLSRLEGHGLVDEHPFLHLDGEKWLQSALDAIEVGKQLGDKVILVTCSTGSTLGLYLESQYPGLVAGHIMLSPNIDVYDPKSFLLVQPWGLQMARKVLGSDSYSWDSEAPPSAEQYWYTTYRIEGLITLKALINQTMKLATFQKIKDPVFMAYYYRDEDNQDHVVSVKRMKEMFAQLGTPDEKKRAVALPNADTHIIGSDIFNEHLNTLWTPLTSFCEEVMHLPLADTSDYITYMDLRPK